MGHEHPLRVGRELAERLGRTDEQGVDQPTRVNAVKAVQTVRQCEHQMRVGHVEYLGQSPLQPGVLGARAALREMAISARVVLPVAMAARVAGQSVASQRGGAAGNDAPPRLGLGRGQEMLCQILSTVLAQCIGQGGHGVLPSAR